MIGRRFVLTSGFMAIVAPACAQSRPHIPRLAVLDWEAEAGAARLEPFRRGLRDEGLVEGSNIAVTYYFAGGSTERADALAAEIVLTKVDVIVALATPAAHAAKRATTTIPIVFSVGDPLGTGLISNLARPGGNLTGASSMLVDIEGKRVQLLQELIPGLKRVAYIGSAVDPATAGFLRRAKAQAARSALDFIPLLIKVPDQVDGALADAVRRVIQAVIIQPLFTISANSSARAAQLTQHYRLPAIGTNADFVRAGGLIAFGPEQDFARQRAAKLVARILAGAPPGSLPVEQPTEFRLALNIKTAKALGLTVPTTLLARADEVIE